MTVGPDAIVVSPWLELRKPITVCGVEYLPRETAIERAGDKAANVDATTSLLHCCRRAMDWPDRC